MRVARFWVPGQGARLGHCEGGTVRALSSPDGPPLESFESLVQLARRTRRDLQRCVQDLRGSASGAGSAYAYQDLDRAPTPGVPHLLLPVVPPEVWAAGVTYERSREARLAETTTVGIYDKVYDAERPEVFFKATPSRCVGPNAPVGIRADSRWTVPEPELGVVLGAEGEVLGYTLGNDMSARDIPGLLQPRPDDPAHRRGRGGAAHHHVPHRAPGPRRVPGPGQHRPAPPADLRPGRLPPPGQRHPADDGPPHRDGDRSSRRVRVRRGGCDRDRGGRNRDPEEPHGAGVLTG